MVKYSKVITGPQSEPITLAEAKAHLKVDGTAEDTYITTLIKVARRICETYSGLSFIDQERELKLDAFPCHFRIIEIPYGPVSEINDFTYIDSNGDEQTLVEGTDFTFDNHSALARVKTMDSWPSTSTDVVNAVTINYKAGYTDSSTVPEEIKQAMLLQIGSLYENRQDEVSGSMSMLSWNSKALLDTVKVYWYAGQD